MPLAYGLHTEMGLRLPATTASDSALARAVSIAPAKAGLQSG